MSILLEICIDSFESAKAAREGGADRLEVCSALAVGGTTPSFGLVEQCVAELEMPVMMMIRPRDGRFVYDSDDVDVMLTDIEVAKSIGVQGIVFGALTDTRTVDRDQCKRLLEAADSLETTFHRAFDFANDPLAAFEEVQQLGFTRLLTSGQKASAVEGADLIRQLVQQSRQVQVVAGAGITGTNAQNLVAQTGVKEIHASASVVGRTQQPNESVSFGDAWRVTTAESVREIKRSFLL